MNSSGSPWQTSYRFLFCCLCIALFSSISSIRSAVIYLLSSIPFSCSKSSSNGCGYCCYAVASSLLPLPFGHWGYQKINHKSSPTPFSQLKNGYTLNQSTCICSAFSLGLSPRCEPGGPSNCSTNCRADAHNSASLSFPTVSFRLFSQLMSRGLAAAPDPALVPAPPAPVPLASPVRELVSGPKTAASSRA